MPFLVLDKSLAARVDRDGQGSRRGLAQGINDVAVLLAQGVAEQAQVVAVLQQLVVAERQVVTAADGLEFVLARAFVDEQWDIIEGLEGVVDGETAQQRTLGGGELACRAVLVAHQVQATVQVQQAWFIRVGLAQVEAVIGSQEQVGDGVGSVLDRPVAQQIVVGREHRAVAAQFLVETLQGRRLHQSPGDVHGVHGVDQRFLDRVVAIARRGGAHRQGLVDPAGGFQRTQHLLETAGLQRIEHAQLRRTEGFFLDGTGVFEQRVIAEIVPHGAAGAVAYQQAAEGRVGAQGLPIFEPGVVFLEIGHCESHLKTWQRQGVTLSRPSLEPDQDTL